MQKGYEKIAMFNQYFALSLAIVNAVQIGTPMQWQNYRKLYMIYRMLPLSVTFNDS